MNDSALSTFLILVLLSSCSSMGEPEQVPQVAAGEPPYAILSAGALEFGDGNVLFVGDSKAAAVHALELRDADFTSQLEVDYGNARTFEGIDLISHVDLRLAAYLGTEVDQIRINDLAVHPETKQLFLSVDRGRGSEVTALIVKINDGQFELLDLAAIPCTSLAVSNAPTDGKLEFGQSQRTLTITDIAYWKGEIFVSGVSNEEFASKLRRATYPFEGEFTETSIEIWHAVHAQFETRAPIIRQTVRELDGKDYLIAVYACTPLVRIPVEDLQPGAQVRGEMIAELGFGNTPVDLITYTDGMDSKDYLLVTHNSRNATRVALTDVSNAEPMPVNVPNDFGPSGLDQFPIPITGAQQLALLDSQWAVLMRNHPDERGRIDLLTLPLPFFFDRSDHIVEMNWPGAPDPFGYKQQND